MSEELPITDNHVPPYMHKNGKSTVRNCAEYAMMCLGFDPSDWRLRDKLIWQINPWIQAEAEARESHSEEQSEALDRLERALLEIVRCRNAFEGPSLDYMQGYLDGQAHVQRIAKKVLGHAVSDTPPATPQPDE